MLHIESELNQPCSLGKKEQQHFKGLINKVMVVGILPGSWLRKLFTNLKLLSKGFLNISHLDAGSQYFSLGCWLPIYLTWNLVPYISHLDAGSQYFSLGIWFPTFLTWMLALNISHLDAGSKYFSLRCWLQIFFTNLKDLVNG